MSNVLVFVLELIGTAAFTVSGAIVGIKKQMDLFGVIVLGVCTAVGGGSILAVILLIVVMIGEKRRHEQLLQKRNGG